MVFLALLLKRLTIDSLYQTLSTSLHRFGLTLLKKILTWLNYLLMMVWF